VHPRSKYDVDGNKIESWLYYDGKLMMELIYTFDEEGFNWSEPEK